MGRGAIPVKDYLKVLPEGPCSIELPNKKYIETYGKKDTSEIVLKRHGSISPQPVCEERRSGMMKVDLNTKMILFWDFL